MNASSGFWLKLRCDGDAADHHYINSLANDDGVLFVEGWGGTGSDGFRCGFTGETLEDCLEQARTEGWGFDGERVLCPECLSWSGGDYRDADEFERFSEGLLRVFGD